MSNQFQTTRGTEHSDRNENGNQIGNDAKGHFESLFGTIHELLIDFYPAQRSVEGKAGEKKRNGKLRNGIHESYKEGLACCFRQGWQAEHCWESNPDEEV